jgi:hypothetical protein
VVGGWAKIHAGLDSAAARKAARMAPHERLDDVGSVLNLFRMDQNKRHDSFFERLILFFSSLQFRATFRSIPSAIDRQERSGSKFSIEV